MKDMLQDLFAHQAWADAEHWRSLAAREGALEDAAVGPRLHHIYTVQSAYDQILRGASRDELQIREFGDYGSMSELRADVERCHASQRELVGGMSAERLAEVLVLPWFKEPPLSGTVAQLLHQVTMHSHYHRGQNATRLRELGGEAPLTDLVIWYWKGKPEPEW